MPSSDNRVEVFRTPWFSVQSIQTASSEPYYLLDLADYVGVVAMTPDGKIVLVRQFRPVVDRITLELPSGHVEAGESPSDAARRELLEETGYDAPQLELLGEMTPDVGRLGNRLWCYFAPDVRPASPPPPAEEGVSVALVDPQDLFARVASGEFDHALNVAVLLLAVLRRRLVVG
jgi:ADP-ribose pyrophosphatase